MLGSRKLEDERRIRRAGGERRQRITQGAGAIRVALVRMAISEVNQAAVLVKVLERVQQRVLPSGKERDNQEDPCETG